MNLIDAAYQYIDRGFCVIATLQSKNAFLPWKQYQKRIITKAEAKAQFSDPRAHSLAIVTGKASGNLEIIDFDLKYDLTGTLYNRYCQAIEENKPGLLERIFKVKTRSAGYHFYYRCSSIEGNQKLARRPASDDEIAKDPNDRIKVLIETRGTEGYVLAPPSEGYKSVTKGPVAEISPQERDILLTIARSFTEEEQQPERPHKSSTYNPKEFGLSPFDDFNKRGDLFSLLEAHGWVFIKKQGPKHLFRRPGKDEGTSGDYHEEKNWFTVFTTSSIFEAQKAYLPYAVYAMLEHDGNYSEAAKALFKKGYGEVRIKYGEKFERKLYNMQNDGATDAQLTALIGQEEKKTPQESAQALDKLRKIWGEKIGTFWDISINGKLSINITRLFKFIGEAGFCLYYYDLKSTTSFRVIREENGFIEDVSTEHLKKFLESYIYSLPDTFDGGVTSDELMEILLKGSSTYFATGMLEYLPRANFNFLADNPEEAFYPFKNGCVVVNSGGAQLKSYKEINAVIWKAQVIDYSISIEENLPQPEFERFLYLISGENDDRLEVAITTIGYLLHKFKDESRAYAVILAEENDDDEKGGGTGKGLFIKALSHLLNTERVDGKNFKLDKSFAFQRVDLTTKLVVIEDTKKNFNFEGFYTFITEGIEIEKKNKDSFFIPYDQSPKFAFTTNYTISGTADHSKRRQVTIEFAPAFSASFTPVDKFGHLFFKDWDKDEWNRFYNFLFGCVSIYLLKGIKKIELSDKIKAKHIRTKYGEDFLFWWQGYIENGCEKWESATQLYTNFIAQSNLDKHKFSQTQFGRAMYEAAKTVYFKPAELKKRRNNQDDNRVEVRIEPKINPN